MNRFFKILKWGLGIFVGLLLILWLAIQLEVVQNFIVDKITSSLSQTLNTKVEIGQVKLNFFKSVEIENVYIEDQNQDTLLSFNHLSATIGLFSLLNQNIQLDDVQLDGLNAKFNRNTIDSTFNFQYIIDGFASNSSSEDTSTSQSWLFGLESATIKNAKFVWQDSINIIYLETFMDVLKVDFDKLDIINQKIIVDQLNIKNPKVHFSSEMITQVDSAEVITLPVFPYSGWDISSNELSIQNGDIRYWINNRPLKDSTFDAQHLYFNNLNLEISDFSWDSTTLKTNLTNLSFEERSGLQLKETQLDLLMDNEKIEAKDILIRTPHSEIRNNTSLTFLNWTVLPDFLNTVNLETQFLNSNIAVEDLEKFLPYLPSEYRIDEPISLNGIVQSNRNQINVNNLDLRVGDILNIQWSGVLNNIIDPNVSEINIGLEKFQIDYKKLRLELPELKLPSSGDSLGLISLSGKFKGGIDELDVINLDLKTSTNTFLRSTGSLKNLDQVEKLSYDLKIDSLKTTAQDIAYFTPNTLPVGLYEMEEVTYSGLLSGTLLNIKSRGDLNTAIGGLTTDIQIEFNPDFSNASYDGRIEINDFDLGVLLADSTLGIAQLNATLKGKGISQDSLDTTINATIKTIGFNDYQYKNIKIEGHLDQLKYVGTANIKDENLNLDFDGLIDFNEASPVFKFDARLDTIDLNALNFIDQKIRISAVVASDFKWSDIEEFLGDIDVNDFYLSNKEEIFFIDSLLIRSTNENLREKELVINSDLLNATFKGDFNLATLPNALQDYINDYFPIDQLITSTDAPDSLSLAPNGQIKLKEQEVTFDIQFFELSNLLQIFTPQVQYLPSAIIRGTFNTIKKDLEVNVGIQELHVQGWEIDSLTWQVKGDEKHVSSNLILPQLTNGATTFRKSNVNTFFADNTFQINFNINNENEQSILVWGAKAEPKGENFLLSFTDSLYVNDIRWDISKEQKIIFNNNLFEVNNFKIEKNYQSISINTRAVTTEEEYVPISIDFSDFELLEISNMLNLEGFNFDGLLNGNVILNDVTKKLHYLADVQVNNFTVNDTVIGVFGVKAKQNPGSPIIDLSVKLNGEDSKMLAKGNYNIETDLYDIRADLNQIPLILVDPFTAGAIQNSSGSLSGYFDLKGSSKQPDINGVLEFKEAATRINYLKTRYRIPNNKITFNEERIDFGTMKIFDSKNDEAVLSGHINHDFFQDVKFDLQFKTDKFRFLNTIAGDNELFYGTLFLGAQVDIGGTLDLPKITVNAKTLPESRISVSAVVDEGVAQQADYIIYGKPNEISLDSLLNLQSISAYKTPEVDLLLNLNLTQDAELIVIVDPATGDQLSCKGNALLTVKMSPKGEVNLDGVYSVSSGAYQFNYQGLVRRSFDIEPNSRLTFVGDPLDTRFDVTAVYKTRTSIYPLISNETSLSESAIRRAKERTDVNVLLRMAGDLDRPIIGFDLNVPESNNGVATIVDQKLSQLREDEVELNKQVFGLLLLNSFVAEQSATASLSTAGENIALSSVSGLISNQLNRLSERYLKGVGLTFDLESYRSQFEGEADATTRTNLNVGLSRSIFNERVTVKIGGVVQLDNSSSSSSSSGLSNIAGDFVLEYQIDKAGNYILRVFQRSDYDAFDDSNSSKTGVGINFKKSFGE